jgi:hypothetical protein
MLSDALREMTVPRFFGGDVYGATSPGSLARLLFGPDVPHFAHPWWLALSHLGAHVSYGTANRCYYAARSASDDVCFVSAS